MIFNSKQLDELEQKHDGSGPLEDGEQKTEESGSDAAMEWRVQLIEEGAESVKRAKARPVDEKLTYEVGSLLFDRESRRFGRVQASVPGFLSIGYLTGGDREYGTLNAAAYLRDFGGQKNLNDLVTQLGFSEDEVLVHLRALGIEPVMAEGQTLKSPAAQEPAAETEAAKAVAAQPASSAKKEKAPAAKKAKAATKGAATKGAATKASAKAKPTGNKGPIDDPNSFIKKNYQAMSNREMARDTGLSEHTIRRKLGEWSLKRTAKQKKAKAKR